MEPTDTDTVATFDPATTEVISPAPAPVLTVRERVEAALLREMEYSADGPTRVRAAEILLGNGFVEAPAAATEAAPAPKKRGRPKKAVK